ncbi:hypothetical protein LX69_00330 [Breznakibacter xylanolyticus]|uniref:Uncharacterized protein n=2 Tax=Breznakibacter xylanolyticus TaxID=990 RepID=A0A2W7NLE6_9BACT|nr:hypothetical protein LX69_00330 [Breznakibacter xylanolyticus]
MDESRRWFIHFLCHQSSKNKIYKGHGMLYICISPHHKMGIYKTNATMQFIPRFTVQAPTELTTFLLSRMPGKSSGYAMAMLASGMVYVNGHAATRIDDMLQPGDRVTFGDDYHVMLEALSHTSGQEHVERITDHSTIGHRAPEYAPHTRHILQTYHDMKYSKTVIGGDKKFGSTKNPLDRMVMHDHQQGMIHPVSGKEMSYHGPMHHRMTLLVRDRDHKQRFAGR